jgi:poly [ADP-ribose] polymerase
MNKCKFYIIQVLQHDTNGQTYCFTRWGRVGYEGQQAIKGSSDPSTSINEYNSKKREKIKGKYVEVFLDWDGNDSPDKK